MYWSFWQDFCDTENKKNKGHYFLISTIYVPALIA